MTEVTTVRTRPVPTTAHRGSGVWILLATDGSPAAAEATATVRDTFHDAEVVVLTVIDRRTVADASTADAIQDETCRQLGRPVRRVVREGRPATIIRDVAETLCIDVVAIGAPARRPRLRISTGEALLRHLDCEVLLVPCRSAAHERSRREAS